MQFHINSKDSQVRKDIRQKMIGFGGNRKLKIYGILHCSSGKRMKRENRVFFVSEEEAKKEGFRPCGHCMKAAYQRWKEQP
ncbi:Ada metal-binding domain-containing protein [Flavobacterium sp.]|uniref:Ada metal-binding domain-containing protein n=1 Tax=Flavobacterium sp. TaxID=239 RepID=UPI003D6B7587